MQMPDTARQMTAETRVAGDCSARRSGTRAPRQDRAAEADLRRKARRQGVLLMGASSLVALAVAPAPGGSSASCFERDPLLSRVT
jgi:hypothetical protein